MINVTNGGMISVFLGSSVKLPDFLSATNIAEDKLRLILKHLDDFME